MKILELQVNSASIQVLCKTKEQWTTIVALPEKEGWVNYAKLPDARENFEHYPKIAMYGDNREYACLAPSTEMRNTEDPEQFIKDNQ